VGFSLAPLRAREPPSSVFCAGPDFAEACCWRAAWKLAPLLNAVGCAHGDCFRGVIIANTEGRNLGKFS